MSFLQIVPAISDCIPELECSCAWKRGLWPRKELVPKRDFGINGKNRLLRNYARQSPELLSRLQRQSFMSQVKVWTTN